MVGTFITVNGFAFFRNTLLLVMLMAIRPKARPTLLSILKCNEELNLVNEYKTIRNAKAN